MSAPGWYPNPDGSGGQRYFDGKNWGPEAPAGPPSAQQKKRPGCFKSVLGLVGVLFVIGFIGSRCDSSDSTSTTSSSSSPSSSVTAGRTTAPTTPLETAPAAPSVATLPGPTPSSSPSYTAAQKNAIAKAQSYLRFSAFSKSGLIKQLEYDDFTNEDATFAVEDIESDNGVDWNDEATKKAKSYLDFSSFSKQGLVSQLEYDGFTRAQAEYGAETAYGG